VTAQTRFHDVARSALAYERSLFSAVEGNWPDLRPDAAGTCSVAWCHGAPGIGLSRVALLRHQDDPATRAEIRAALSTT
jgi:lantibiotic modifying enzyme